MDFTLEELPSILRGIRYLNGYNQKELANILGVAQASVHRWETNYSKLERRKDRILNLLKNTKYSKKELIYYGNINIKNLIEEVKEQNNLSYRKCAEIFDVCDATLKWIREEKIRLDSRTIKKIIDKYNDIKNKDKRDILFKLFLNRFLSNKKGLYIRYMRQELGFTQKELAKKLKLSENTLWKIEVGYNRINSKLYNELRDGLIQLSNKSLTIEKEVLQKIENQSHPELFQLNNAKKHIFIIGFRIGNDEGDQFEKQVSILFQNLGFEVFKNPVLANKEMTIQHCIDIFAVKGKTQLCIECKDCSETQIKGKTNIYGNRLVELKEICPNLVIALNNKVNKNKKSIEKRKGVIILDSEDLKTISNNPKMLSNFLEKNKKSLPKMIKDIKDVKNLRDYCNFSNPQLSRLVGLSNAYIFRILNGKRPLTKKIKIKIENILKLTKQNEIRDLHFRSNYILTFSKNYKKKANNLEIWNKAKKYNKIINFVSNNSKGSFLEKNVSKIFKEIGGDIFQNVILANESVSERHEIDIYAIKNNQEIIVELKNKLRGIGTSSSSISRELEHKSKILGVNKKTIITNAIIKRTNPFLRKNIQVLRYDENLKENLKNILR